VRKAIEFDFTPPRRYLTLTGGILLMAGLLAGIGVLLEYRSVTLHRAGLELKLEAMQRSSAQAQAAAAAALDSHASASLQQAATELSTPWTELLAELEQASKDSQDQVAVLGIEPDHAKHAVRVSAEARSLALALAYVQRLQGSHALQFPMLDRHELRADDPQHPVRFELTAAWRDQP
jgi:hypothetical protein